MTKITQLPIASTISDTGVFVILDQGLTKQLPWQTLKAGGLKGNTGTQGIQGPLGPRGPTGTVTTIQVGTVTGTTTASVIAIASTVSTNVTILNFGIPIGPKGDTGTYVLSVATTSTLGGIKVGPTMLISGDGMLDVPATPTATSTTTGVVKPGEGISITLDGTISATTATQYYLPPATDTILGGVKIGAGVNVTNGVISVTTGAFALQTATNTILGGVKIGSNISVSATGTISVSTGAGYVLPISSATILGGIRLGENLLADNSGIVRVSSLIGTAITGTVLASNITATSITALGILDSLTVAGKTTIGQTLEVYRSISTATGVVTHDCTSATIFLHTAPMANWTANFTNVDTIPNRVISVALLITQGTTSYIPNVVQVNGAAFTINWQGGVTPTGNANKKDLVNFTLVSIGFGNYTVLGSLASYG
jgi:hypothetical protein